MAKKSTVENKRKSSIAKQAAGAPAVVEETAAGTEAAEAAPVKDGPKRGATRKTLVKEAYRQVGRKLADAKDPTKAIDDLVKLAKIEKDMDEEEGQGVGEVRVRWMESEKDESSKES